MSARLRNTILGLYLISIVGLLVAAGAMRTDPLDVHWRDMYYVQQGFILFMPFAVWLSILLAIYSAGWRLFRIRWLTALHAFGSLLLIGLFIIMLFRDPLFKTGLNRPRLLNLADPDSGHVFTLKTFLYWQLLFPLNVLLSVRAKSFRGLARGA